METTDNSDEYLSKMRRNSRLYVIAAGVCLVVMLLSFEFRTSGWLWYIFNPFTLLLTTLTFLFLSGVTKYISWYYREQREILTLFRAWEQETVHLFGGRDIHRFHKEIVLRGKLAARFLLEELSRRECHVFTMLAEITGENPTSKEHRGNIRAMRQDWLAWGKKNGYL